MFLRRFKWSPKKHYYIYCDTDISCIIIEDCSAVDKKMFYDPNLIILKGVIASEGNRQSLPFKYQAISKYQTEYLEYYFDDHDIKKQNFYKISFVFFLHLFSFN